MNKKNIAKIADMILNYETQLDLDENKEQFEKKYESNLNSLLEQVFEDCNTWRKFDEVLLEIDEIVQEKIKLQNASRNWQNKKNYI